MDSVAQATAPPTARAKLSSLSIKTTTSDPRPLWHHQLPLARCCPRHQLLHKPSQPATVSPRLPASFPKHHHSLGINIKNFKTKQNIHVYSILSVSISITNMLQEVQHHEVQTRKSFHREDEPFQRDCDCAFTHFSIQLYRYSTGDKMSQPSGGSIAALSSTPPVYSCLAKDVTLRKFAFVLHCVCSMFAVFCAFWG